MKLECLKLFIMTKTKTKKKTNKQKKAFLKEFLEISLVGSLKYSPVG